MIVNQRCEIIDAEGLEMIRGSGIMMSNPETSVPHIGKKGYASHEGARLKIILDDKTIIYGDQCWWKPIENEND